MTELVGALAFATAIFALVVLPAGYVAYWLWLRRPDIREERT